MRVLVHIRMIIAFTLAQAWELIVISETWESPELDELVENYNGWVGDDDEPDPVLASVASKAGIKLRGLPEVKYQKPGVYLYIGAYDAVFDTSATEGGYTALSGTLHPIQMSPHILEMMEAHDEH